MTGPGNMPASRHSVHSNAIAESDARSVSTAWSEAGERARPRKEIPNARTKQAAARAADNANTAPIAGIRILRPHWRTEGLSRMACNASHSETNPLSGGSAEIAAQPARKSKA